MRFTIVSSLLLCFLSLHQLTAQDYYHDNLTTEEVDSIQHLLYDKGDYEGYAAFTKKIMERIAEEVGAKDTSYAFYENELGFIYYEMADYENAAVHFTSALDIIEEQLGKEGTYRVEALNGLGGVYQMTGRYEEAENVFLELEAIANKHWEEDPTTFAIILNNFARLYWRTGRLAQAERLLLKTKKTQRESLGKYHKDYAITISNLAILYTNTRRYKEAELLFKEVKEIRARVLGKNHPYYASALHDLGRFYLNIKEYQKSEPFLLEALSIQKEFWGEKHEQVAMTFLSLCTMAYNNGNLEQAEEYGIQSLLSNTTATEEDFSLDQLHKHEYFSSRKFQMSISSLLKIYKKKNTGNEPEQLRDYYELIKNTIYKGEEIKNSFDSDQNKLMALDQNFQLIEQGIATALVLNTPQSIQEAFRFAEQSKSIFLTDVVKGTAARSLGYLPDSLSELELQLQKDIHELKNQRLQVRTPEEKVQISSQLVELELQKEQFMQLIQKDYPNYHALKYQNILIGVEEVQQTLDNKTLLLEYMITDTVVYLFSISKNDIEIYPLSLSRKEWIPQLKKNRLVLSDFEWVIKNEKEAYDYYTQTSYWLYKNILSKALKNREGIERLVIITDKELGYLPFETLLTEEVTTKIPYKKLPYLLQQYTISYDYSATLWKQNLNKNNQAQYNNQVLSYAASYGNQSSDAKQLASRSSDETSLRANLEPLESAQKEVENLRQQFKGHYGFEERANEQAFKANASEYSIIHLAMHGIVDPEEPMLSSLVFSENGDSLENNFLYAYEISKMDLNANMAVLSACETGYGELQKGEGIISLGRSFMYAGVPALVVSLWSVHDASTATIMDYFYENLSQGMPKDVALRQAKKTYLEQKDGLLTHPSFWSPFIQIGNAQPIAIKKKQDWVTWGIAGGLIALVLVVIIGLKSRRQEQ